MKTIQYEVQIKSDITGKWVTSSKSNPSEEGMNYSLQSAQQYVAEGRDARVIEIQEQQKLLWPDVGDCG